MSKISTAYIKEQICKWLSSEDPEVREQLVGHYFYPDVSVERVGELKKSFGLADSATEQEVMDRIWKTWTDGNQWSREEKYRVADEWETFMGPDYGSKRPVFIEDFAGSHEEILVLKYGMSPKEAEKCWYRMFVPKNDFLGSNFRLEVISTPDDDQIIGWVVVVD